MKWEVPSQRSKWWVIPPLLVGVAVVGFLVAHREGPQRRPAREESRSVRVIDIKSVNVVPRILGYGTAESGLVWHAVAEVRGRVKEVHTQLKPGAMVKQGEVLLQLDTAEYALAITQIEAEMAQVNAQLDELVVQQENNQTSLEIEQSSLELAERERRRVETLAGRNAAPQADVDKYQRNVFTQRQIVQKLQNSLKLVPQQKKSLEATLDVKKASQAQAELDLAKTVIRAPFDCRIGEVDIEPGQFLAIGQSLFEAHGTALTEVEVQVPLDQLRTLIHPQHSARVPVNMDAQTIGELFDFDVTVRYRSSEFLAAWTARVVRIRERLDPRTRTIGLVLAVSEPYKQAIPGKRPPLIHGMYCEAELRGEVRAARVVIPQAAFHDGHVYVVDSDRRLRRRQVEVAFGQSSFLCLNAGLRDGERLVVSDPTPAIEGLLLEPVLDDRLQQQLIAEATGEGSLK